MFTDMRFDSEYEARTETETADLRAREVYEEANESCSDGVYYDEYEAHYKGRQLARLNGKCRNRKNRKATIVKERTRERRCKKANKNYVPKVQKHHTERYETRRYSVQKSSFTFDTELVMSKKVWKTVAGARPQATFVQRIVSEADRRGELERVRDCYGLRDGYDFAKACYVDAYYRNSIWWPNHPPRKTEEESIALLIQNVYRYPSRLPPSARAERAEWTRYARSWRGNYSIYSHRKTACGMIKTTRRNRINHDAGKCMFKMVRGTQLPSPLKGRTEIIFSPKKRVRKANTLKRRERRVRQKMRERVERRAQLLVQREKRLCRAKQFSQEVLLQEKNKDMLRKQISECEQRIHSIKMQLESIDRHIAACNEERSEIEGEAAELMAKWVRS